MLYVDNKNYVLYVDEETFSKIMSTEKDEIWLESAFKSLKDQGVDCFLIQGFPFSYILLTTEYKILRCKCSECQFRIKQMGVTSEELLKNAHNIIP